ncbi:MAG: DUF4145 domain-containing protein [Candidatus Sericytochromatia bacterium]
MNQKFSLRYDELLKEAQQILQSQRHVSTDFGAYIDIDEDKAREWKVKAKHLISATCGENSQHLKDFLYAEKQENHEEYIDVFKRIKPIFAAARNDFQGGYLVGLKALIQAEIFDSELDQARELLGNHYKIPAAVVSGIVLETALRQLCDKANILHSKMDKMNADLVKAGIYNQLQQKRITALAHIRNSAAHGKPEDFTVEDVERMISEIEQFLAVHLV